MNDDDDLTDITAHPIGISAVTQRGTIVNLELLLDDSTDD